jgi:predicted ATP-grasp superfamily ATP-dependent carboligase
MRVFVYEWTCCVENAPPSLRREGWAMLRAVLEDFQQGNVETVTLVNDTFHHQPPGMVHRVRSTAQEEALFRASAASADASLVIAPETFGILEERSRWVDEAGGTSLGPSVEAISLTSDKLSCGQRWQQRQVQTPSVWSLNEAPLYPAVLKPRDGAGSQGTFLVRNEPEASVCLKKAQVEGYIGDFILQDFVSGQPASVAFLIGDRQSIPLRPAEQLLSSDGRFHYLGGRMPLPSPLGERAIDLASRAIRAIPGLHGYVGVDVVLADNPNGSDDWAIEINPRLTTSYLGLRKLYHDNLALAMLKIATAQPIDTLKWRDEVIYFDPDGKCW